MSRHSKVTCITRTDTHTHTRVVIKEIVLRFKMLHFFFSAVTTWNFIMGGTVKSYGLLYVEFIRLFQSSPVETGLIGLVFGIIAMLICKC